MDFETSYVAVLKDLLERGQQVRIGRSLSIASEQVTLELLNYSFDLQEPRARLLFNPVRRFNLLRAVGRFAWMMSGSDRLADIEYYEPRARAFSDNKLTIPGSDDGARLFRARSGLDQIAKNIELLRREANTRRAAAVAYFPEDAGRVSRDIPCTLALIYNLREGQLHATTVMRANDAFGVLPYDVFLFSMLAEIVACEIGAEFAHYHHFAVSMHIYERDRARAEAAITSRPPGGARSMTPMPRGASLVDTKALLRFEQDLRLRRWTLKASDYRRRLERAVAEFHPYWRDFALALVLHALKVNPLHDVDRTTAMEAVLGEMQEPFRLLAVDSLEESRVG